MLIYLALSSATCAPQNTYLRCCVCVFFFSHSFKTCAHRVRPTLLVVFFSFMYVQSPCRQSFRHRVTKMHLSSSSRMCVFFIIQLQTRFYAHIHACNTHTHTHLRLRKRNDKSNLSGYRSGYFYHYCSASFGIFGCSDFSSVSFFFDTITQVCKVKDKEVHRHKTDNNNNVANLLIFF